MAAILLIQVLVRLLKRDHNRKARVLHHAFFCVRDLGFVHQ